MFINGIGYVFPNTVLYKRLGIARKKTKDNEIIGILIMLIAIVIFAIA
ncbi:MAG: hypothetical protein QXH07_03155 [Thermoplasmata archaeon]